MLQFHPIFLAKLAESRFPERYYEICRTYGFGDPSNGRFSAREIVTGLKPVAEVHAFPGPGRAFEVRMPSQPGEFSFSFTIELGNSFNPCMGINAGNLKLQDQMCSIVADTSDALGKPPPNPRYPRPSFFTIPGLATCVQDHYELALLFFKLYGEALCLVSQPCVIVDSAEYYKARLAKIPRVDVARTVALLNRGDINATKEYVLELCPGDTHHPTATPGFLFTLLARDFHSMPAEQLRAMHDKLACRFLRRDLIMAAVELLLAQNKVGQAKEMVDLLHEDMAYQGHRRLLRYFAKVGDLSAYQTTLKRCDRKQQKSELKQIEAEMAESYSAKDGVEAALKVFGCTNAWHVFLILRAQKDKLSYDELSKSSSLLLEPIDCCLHTRLQIQLLAAEVGRGVNVSTAVRSVLHSVLQIGPGEKSYGNVGMRQDLLHELGEMLLKHNQPETVSEILVLMSRSSRRADLQRKLNKHSSGETAH